MKEIEIKMKTHVKIYEKQVNQNIYRRITIVAYIR